MLSPIRKTITVPCPQAKAFDIFIEDMPSWWPLDKRSMSLMTTKAPAQGLTVEPHEGGRIVEMGSDGSEHHWGTITQYDPYSYIAMDFHMGMPASKASLLELEFESVTEDSTRVVLTHSNWEAFGDLAQDMRNGYGSSWGLLFEEAYLRACGGTPAPTQ